MKRGAVRTREPGCRDLYRRQEASRARDAHGDFGYSDTPDRHSARVAVARAPGTDVQSPADASARRRERCRHCRAAPSGCARRKGALHNPIWQSRSVRNPRVRTRRLAGGRVSSGDCVLTQRGRVRFRATRRLRGSRRIQPPFGNPRSAERAIRTPVTSESGSGIQPAPHERMVLTRSEPRSR